MKYRVTHKTRFDYKTDVITAQHLLRLKPRTIPSMQWLDRHALSFSASEIETLENTDYFGNAMHELRLTQRHSELVIDSYAEITVQARDEMLLDLSPGWRHVAQTLSVPMTEAQWSAAQFCFPSRHVDPDGVGPDFDFLFDGDLPVLRIAMNLTEFIYREFEYQGGITDVHTPVREIVDLRQGVCQDFAHLAIAVLRKHGLAARYVSGYILSQFESRPALVGAEASHAWISVFCPEFGWVDFDPTNNQMTSDQHIVLAWGRDYADVAPTRGSILGGGAQSLSVDVKVRVIN